jgi:hypothetical protein
MADRPIVSTKDRFAELLSQGLSTVQIRERLGLGNNSAQSYMNKICRDLGAQARG